MQVRSFQIPENIAIEKFWINQNPILTSIMAAVSIFFPEGERFLIDTMREAKGHITDPDLLQEINLFIGQEAHHRKAHREFNNSQLPRFGIDIDGLEGNLKQKLDERRSRPLIERLAVGAAIEHFTALFGEFILTNPAFYTGVPEVMVAFFRWHAYEEIEHKSALFNTFNYLSANDYRLRRKAFVEATVFFSEDFNYLFQQIMKQMDAKPTLKHRLDATRLFLGWNGFFRTNLMLVADYFKKDFHPSHHDHHNLINQWEERESNLFSKYVMAVPHSTNKKDISIG